MTLKQNKTKHRDSREQVRVPSLPTLRDGPSLCLPVFQEGQTAPPITGNPLQWGLLWMERTPREACVCVCARTRTCADGPAALSSSLGVGVSKALPDIQRSPLPPPKPLWGSIMNV